LHAVPEVREHERECRISVGVTVAVNVDPVDAGGWWSTKSPLK
jgi:hypothetical protein